MAAALMGSHSNAEALLPQLQQEVDNMEHLEEDDMTDDNNQEDDQEDDQQASSADDDEEDDNDMDEDDDQPSSHEDDEGVLPRGKSAALAKAVGKILDAAAARGGDNVVLAASRTAAKRTAEEATADAGAREAKRLRKELKTRGRKAVPRQGQDPKHDAQERVLLRVATKGVVQLFNAVTKAQHAHKHTAAAGVLDKGGSVLSKADFLKQLKQAGGGGSGGGVVATGKGGRGAQGGASASNPKWDVLQESYDGVRGRSKMKDWDLESSGGEEEPVGESDLSSDENA